MAFFPDHVRLLIRHSLQPLGLWSPEAEELLMGTCAVESDFGTYLRQRRSGPARGPMQVEPDTELDIWQNHLAYRQERVRAVVGVCGVGGPDRWSLECNLAYNVIMARLKYRMCPGALPAATDLDGQAAYWDRYYNANYRYGWPGEYSQKYIKYCKG